MQSGVYKTNVTQVWLSTKEDRDIGLYINGGSTRQKQDLPSKGRQHVCEHGTMLVTSDSTYQQSSVRPLQVGKNTLRWPRKHCPVVSISLPHVFTLLRPPPVCPALKRLLTHPAHKPPLQFLFDLVPTVTSTHKHNAHILHLCYKKFLPWLSITSSSFAFTHIQLSSCAPVCSFLSPFVNSWNNGPNVREALCMLLIFLLNQNMF